MFSVQYEAFIFVNVGNSIGYRFITSLFAVKIHIS